MIFAAYADVGAGLAFLLLLALSTLGLAALLWVALLRLVRLRAPELCALAAGFLQAWLVYLWARFGASGVSRPTLEWVWLVSLGVVVLALVAGAVLLRRRKSA